ncbi:MAG: DUF4232 domain-containing protein [Gulosibacter sp.]|uniref:DUF4232 domain-containing protein n=1 Tax=Gulosibacter sp. TaxID=2817531 RepID=UPI003F927402
MQRRMIAAGVFAALWLLFGLGSYALQFAGGAATTVARLIPSPLTGTYFGLPLGWVVAVHALTVLVVFAGYTAIVSLLASRSRVSFATGWLAAVLTACLVGGVLDLGRFVAWVGILGIRGSLNMMESAPQIVFWALLVGWIPGLIAASSRRAEGDRTKNNPKVSLFAVTSIAICAAVALPFVAHGASDASQAQLLREQEEAEAEALANADPAGAAPRDPDATGEPVPTVVPSTTPAPADACTSANSTIMAPSADAATGHRVQQLQLVNTSDAPCTVEGYPDVAFGDQNGHLLDVQIEHGDSFMAQDPGPVPITLEPGDSAAASLGWDANSVHGSLAARSLWAAAYPGAERLNWGVTHDIVPGATVYVTAWQRCE